MKKIAVSFVFLLMSLAAFCQITQYNLGSVPVNVKKNAAVIVRNENIVFDVKDVDKAYYTVDKTITITGPEGKDELNFAQHTNKMVELTDAEIRVFDTAGKQTAKYKKSDMNSIAYGDGLVDDGKLTYFMVAAASYPITLSIKFELKFKGTLQYPPYHIAGAGEGVENSSFTARVPVDLDLRYKEKNIHLTPEITTEDKYKLYKWTVKNLVPLEYEEGAVSTENRYPTVLLAPNRFKMYDTEGDMSSWQQFGNWENGLTQGLGVLPDDRKAFYSALVKNAHDEREKVKLVYQYLQKNFRYVSIQLGIGGYKPFPAVFTDQKKYGDCKGLSFYTHAVLEAIGIKSYVALVNAGYNEEPADLNFPCNQFNHMILCVPQKKDSIWLECTSNTNEFAVLGNFTENRNALLITENGGVLVPTPKSKSTDNLFNSYTKVWLSEDASGKINANWKTSGEFTDGIKQYILDEKKDDQKKAIVGYYGFKQPDEFDIEKKSTEDAFITSISLNTERIPEFVAGSKMFISPRVYKICPYKLPAAENRRLDFYFGYPFIKTDTTVFMLPDGYIADVLPPEKNLSTVYTTWSSKCWYSAADKAIFTSSRLELRDGKIPAAAFVQAKTFFDEVLKDDAQRIVIKKQ